MGHHTPYSFSGGPENYGFCFFGNLVSRAGPWEGETQDYKFYHLNRPDARRTVTIINDDNPDFEGTVNAFQAIDSFIMAKPRQDYGPLPSEFHFWCGGTANSNTWCRYMLKQNPYEYRGGYRYDLISLFERAIDKFPDGTFKLGMDAEWPWAPGWNISVPYNDAPNP